jgi:hypothetical protein
MDNCIACLLACAATGSWASIQACNFTRNGGITGGAIASHGGTLLVDIGDFYLGYPQYGGQPLRYQRLGKLSEVSERCDK